MLKSRVLRWDSVAFIKGKVIWHLAWLKGTLLSRVTPWPCWHCSTGVFELYTDIVFFLPSFLPSFLLFFLCFLFCFAFQERASLYNSPGCPGTCFVAHTHIIDQSVTVMANQDQWFKMDLGISNQKGQPLWWQDWILLYTYFIDIYWALHLSLFPSLPLPFPSTLPQGLHVPNLLRRPCLFLLSTSHVDYISVSLS